MRATFLPLHLQETIFLFEKIFSMFSIPLSVLAMGLLIKQTPPNQAVIRNYLIYIQVFVILTDCALQILFEPIVLFPVWAGYCCGILSRIFSVPPMFGFVVFCLSNIGVSVVVCCLYRHQAILFDSNPFKLRKRTLQVIRFVLFAFFNCGGIALMFRPTNLTVVDKLIDDNGLQWIRDRSNVYLVEQWTFPLFCTLLTVIAVLFCATLSVLGLFGHMYHVLNQDAEKRSGNSIAMIRKSLTTLFIQLVIPLSLIVIPAMFIGFGLAIPNLISFEVSFAAFYVIHLHGIGHSIILLTITTTYRKALLTFLRCDCKSRSVSVHSVG